MGNYATMAGPDSFTTQGVEALKLNALNKKLAIESTLDDVFESFSANVIPKDGKVVVPDAIFLKLEAVPTGANTVTTAMLRPLTGTLTAGSASATPGSEAKQSLKYSTFYYDEYGYTVASEAWGKNANDAAIYGVYEQIQPQMSHLLKEERGRRIRQALVERYDAIAGNAIPAALSTNAKLNRNVFIGGVAISSQPVFKDLHATYQDNISAALEGISAAATASLDFILAAGYYAKAVKKIEPIMIGGKPMYVMMLASNQIAELKRNSAGKMGDIFTKTNRYTNDDVAKFPGIIGEIGNCVIIEDTRAPVMTCVEGTNTLAVKYVKPGNVDERPSGIRADGQATNYYDVGFLLGKAAICEWEVKAPHFETETQNYGRSKGNGVFGEGGIQVVEYDDATGWAGTNNENERINTGSMVLLNTRCSVTNA